MQAAHQGVAADNSAAHVLVKFGVHFHGALRWPNSRCSAITTQTFINVYCQRISGYGLCVGS
jgi:hypothetical protein